MQTALKERLFRAYLHEGQSISDHYTLLKCASDAGLSPGRSQDVLSGNAFSDEVRADQQVAAESGINGVPFFVIGEERYGLSGAQPAEALLEVLRQARR